jgi:Transposase IS4
MAPDRRKIIGSDVTCKAMHVTSIQECNRRYGSNAKSKILDGVVVEVTVERNNPTNRAQTFIVADWELGNGRTKRAKVHIRFTLLKEAPEVPQTPTVTAVAIVPAASSPEDTITVNIEEEKTDNNDDNNFPFENATLDPPTPIVEGTNGFINDINGLNDVPQQEPEQQPRIDDMDFGLPDTEDEDEDEELPPVTNKVNVHGRDWVNEVDVPPFGFSVNGVIPYREWGLRIPTGETWREGVNGDESITRLEVFLQLFPPRQLSDLFTLTNVQLRAKHYRETTKTELLKFIGVIILCTKYEWNNRSDLWAEHPASKYEVSPQIGKRTGMKRKRFDELWSCIRFSAQPDTLPDNMSAETYRWMLVDGFIRNFNNHRSVNFIPSDRLVVDESFSRWYGQGGNWINHGLPMFVAMDRKPEDGCEIQNSACGRTGIMLQLKLVKTSREARNEEDDGDDQNLNHGTKILLKLVRPWNNTNRVVCADSYFASVQTAKELLRVGLKFIGCVKTATREFPMAHLQAQELGEKGTRFGMVSYNDDNIPSLLALVWNDRERRYFVASTSSFQEGQPQVRHRWRQLVSDLTTPPTCIEVVVPQTAITELYFAACGKIDQHNRDRQATLGLERKFKTHDWSMRVNMSILSMCIVDSWRVWSRICSEEQERNKETQKAYYGNLAAELIDNNFDQVGGVARRRSRNDDDEDPVDVDLIDPMTGLARSGDGVYLRRCTRKRKNDNHVHQGRCLVCKVKTSYVCAKCVDDDNAIRQPWVCNPETGRMCFATHRMQKHTDE